MIEPTDEMIEKAGLALYGERPMNPATRVLVRHAASAILAIVERDYRIEPKSPWELPGRSCGDPHPGSPCWKRDWVGEPYLPCEIEAQP